MTVSNCILTVAFQLLCFILDETFLLHPHPQRDLRQRPRNNCRVLTFRAKRQLPPTLSHIQCTPTQMLLGTAFPTTHPLAGAAIAPIHAYNPMQGRAFAASCKVRCTRCTPSGAVIWTKNGAGRGVPSFFFSSMNSIPGCGTQKMIFRTS